MPETESKPASKPIWTQQRYGGERFAISRNIHGSVHYRMLKEDKTYVAYFMDTKLGSWDGYEEAKGAVEKRAKAELEYALNRLNTALEERAANAEALPQP